MEPDSVKSRPVKAAIFIGVRMKSTRLPRKALLDIGGKTAVERLIERLKWSKLSQLIVLCTSNLPEDDPLVDVAIKNSIEYFRGSADDKLDRYLNAASKYGVDFVVITEGDNIFYEPEIIDNIIRDYQRGGADYIGCKGLPLGTAPHGLKIRALSKVCQAKAETDTEVWGGYFTDTGLCKVEHLEFGKELNHPEIRLTLDYPEDYELLKVIFERLYSPGKLLPLREIISFLLDNPHIMEINKNAQEAYLEHIKKSAAMKIKGTTTG